MGYEHLLAVEHKPLHLISPNLHVILIHFPLGIFVFGLFLQVFSFLWRRSTARVAARWMILLGGLLAVPAALTGIDAYADVAEHTRGGLSDTQWHFLSQHILFAGIGAGLATVMVTIALALSDGWRRRLYIPILVLLCGAAASLTYGSHFGGEGIYLEKIAVQMRGEAATGIEWWAPARSTHILLAGLAMAVALGALGASLRTVSLSRAQFRREIAESELEALAAATAPAGQPIARRVTDDLTVARSLNADAEVPLPRPAAARFWLLGTLLFLVALGFGVWFLISQEDTAFLEQSHVTPASLTKEVWSTATATKPVSQNRRGIHIALGCALVVVPLLLAGIVRWMPRARFIIGVLCLLVALMIAAEIWLGVLLIYKGASGPVYKFQSAESQAMLVRRVT